MKLLFLHQLLILSTFIVAVNSSLRPPCYHPPASTDLANFVGCQFDRSLRCECFICINHEYNIGDSTISERKDVTFQGHHATGVVLEKNRRQSANKAYANDVNCPDLHLVHPDYIYTQRSALVGNGDQPHPVVFVRKTGSARTPDSDRVTGWTSIEHVYKHLYELSENPDYQISRHPKHITIHYTKPCRDGQHMASCFYEADHEITAEEITAHHEGQTAELVRKISEGGTIIPERRNSGVQTRTVTVHSEDGTEHVMTVPVERRGHVGQRSPHSVGFKNVEKKAAGIAANAPDGKSGENSANVAMDNGIQICIYLYIFFLMDSTY